MLSRNAGSSVTPSSRNSASALVLLRLSCVLVLRPLPLVRQRSSRVVGGGAQAWPSSRSAPHISRAACAAVKFCNQHKSTALSLPTLAMVPSGGSASPSVIDLFAAASGTPAPNSKTCIEKCTGLHCPPCPRKPSARAQARVWLSCEAAGMSACGTRRHSPVPLPHPGPQLWCRWEIASNGPRHDHRHRCHHHNYRQGHDLHCFRPRAFAPLQLSRRPPPILCWRQCPTVLTPPPFPTVGQPTGSAVCVA